LKVSLPYTDEDVHAEELFGQARKAVELCVGKEPHEMFPISRFDMVALKVKRYVFESNGISVDI
jgi:hypothetical protein